MENGGAFTPRAILISLQLDFEKSHIQSLPVLVRLSILKNLY